MKDYIGCGLPMLIGHCIVGYFIGQIIGLSHGSTVATGITIGYIALFPVICWIGWGISGPINRR